MRNSRSGYISWLTRVYNEAERLLLNPVCTEYEVLAKSDLIFTAFSRFEEVHFSLLTLLEEDYEGRKCLEDSFAYQLERRTTFLAKVDNWIVKQSVDPKDSASLAGLSVPTKTSSSSTGSSKLKLREARERRELAHLRMQQLQLSQEPVQKRVEEERLKLRHEYELASASERIWMEPEAALELKPVGRGLNEKFLQPRYSEVPKDASVPRPVCQHVPYERNPGLTESVSKDRVTPGESFLNHLAPEWESKPLIPFPTSLSDDCGTKSGTERGDFSNLVQSLTSALTLGFSMPRPKILAFDESPLEYWKFIRSFEVNVAGLTYDPRKKLTYLIQYCSGEAREVIENCCVLGVKGGLREGEGDSPPPVWKTSHSNASPY